MIFKRKLPGRFAPLEKMGMTFEAQLHEGLWIGIFV
jgi:hypothetical protein